MNFLKKINSKAKADANTGFGTNAASYGGRFINKDGTANIQKRGIGFWERISWYHTMLGMPKWKFLIILFGFYITINFIFALVYYFIGIENLNGISGSSELERFGGAYFFSAQTFTTVGYGHISPKGFLSSAVAASEALIGLLSFAIATGLFYARFSKPKAHLQFSKNAIIAPYQDKTALMIRLSPHKNTGFTDAEAKITLGIVQEENGIVANKFYILDLELNKINALTLSWTLVHPITEESPLFGFTQEDFNEIDGEILVFIKTFDDMFSTTVAARTSYTFGEVVYGAKFEMMYTQNNSDTKTILNLDKLNSFNKVKF